MHTLLYLKWITNKDLLYSTWNSTQCYVAASMGVEFGENGYMCMYGSVPLLFTWNYDNIANGLSVQSLSHVRFCKPMDCSTPGFPVHHQLPVFTQTYVHWVGDAIQPSHPLSSPSPPALNLFQHQGLFQGVNSLHHVDKVLEFQLQH